MKFASIGIACFALAFVPAFADENGEAEDWVQRVYLEYVKGDMHDEYREVVGDWNECITEADDSMEWWVFRAETGNMNRYAFVLGNQRWSEFDSETPELDACYEQFKDRYHAAVDKVYASFDIYMDEHSYHVDDDKDRKIAWVTTFELEDSRAFLENVKKYAEAAREKDWHEPFYFYSSVGGEHHSGIYVVSPAASFSEFDGDNGFWQMLEEHFGEEEFKRMREIDRAAIADYYADVWVRVDELSHMTE
ncbi:hypothetical protein [Wenzhouxiangella sediminis]|uniref:Uncharacterized protein n=1 Tax=Wenzhouxiangella sediminis TaxID=1792836 RepID=A0A3E1K5J3_9GAMM|nr:hypothetical protein [Wenzhouxiangella sediminis]RFF29200.1 hypothetical protein DZC52_13915 [Wenzhouxiangella sediminis]